MTHTPHDALFKTVFSDPQRAAEILRDMFGPAVSAHIDFTRLRVEDGSFIDDDLRASQVDMLYSTTLAARPALLYLVYEHQSSGDWAMPLRLLRYMLRVWDAHRVAHPKDRTLPAILSSVLHHSDEGWRAATTFEALVDLPADVGEAVWSFIPRFRFALDDIGAAGVAALETRAPSAFLQLTLRALLEARSAHSIDRLLASWHDLLRAVLADPGSRDVLRPVLRYLLEVRRDADYGSLNTTTRKLEPQPEELMQTIADMLRNEGRQEGRQEGHREGLRKGLLFVLRTRYGTLSPSALARIEHADTPTLDRWMDRIETTPSLQALLDG